jgi:hypothetical protein
MDRHRIAICVVRIRRTTGDEADEHYGGSSHPTPHCWPFSAGLSEAFRRHGNLVPRAWGCERESRSSEPGRQVSGDHQKGETPVRAAGSVALR